MKKLLLLVVTLLSASFMSAQTMKEIPVQKRFHTMSENGKYMITNDQAYVGIYNTETDEFDEIIKIAIINHNRGRIEDGLTERQLLHAKLVRDADKTDIFYILLTGDEKIAWETDNMNNETITDEIFREFMEDKHIDYKNIKTGGDSLVSHFAYIYDLYSSTL